MTTALQTSDAGTSSCPIMRVDGGLVGVLTRGCDQVCSRAEGGHRILYIPATLDMVMW